MSKKYSTFAEEFDEPTALATDSGHGIPILTGEVAERFVRMAEENERKAIEMSEKPMTKEEAEKKLSYSKIMYRFEKDRLKELEIEIKKLEDFINKNS